MLVPNEHGLGLQISGLLGVFDDPLAPDLARVCFYDVFQEIRPLPKRSYELEVMQGAGLGVVWALEERMETMQDCFPGANLLWACHYAKLNGNICTPSQPT